MSTRTGAGRRWIQCLATEVEALLFSVRGPTFFKGFYRLGGGETEPDERQDHGPDSYMRLGAFADMSAPRRARQPGAAANGHRRSNQPSREQLHRENERLLRELEDLRRKVAETEQADCRTRKANRGRRKANRGCGKTNRGCRKANRGCGKTNRGCRKANRGSGAATGRAEKELDQLLQTTFFGRPSPALYP